MRIFVILLAGVLVGLTGLSAWLLLQSCAVRIPLLNSFVSVCEPEQLALIRADLVEIDKSNQALETRIAALEHQLGGVICKAAPPPPPPPLPPPVPLPTETETPSGLAPDAFNQSDISVMEGCWRLSSDLAVRDIGTGIVSKFDRWRICFDANGYGTQVMRSTNGVKCKGRMNGRMPGDGQLSMREPGNLQCDNNSSIFQREITCRLDGNGLAQCDTWQPETKSRSTATLRRARR